MLKNYSKLQNQEKCKKHRSCFIKIMCIWITFVTWKTSYLAIKISYKCIEPNYFSDFQYIFT